jgi:glycosyltransferase involved in cell wall biosynthesis
MKVLAIRSDFVHHGAHSGYKQILNYTKPYKVIGVNERSSVDQSKLLNAYCWPYEFVGYRYRKEIDLVHHLYADEFFRFSARLYSVPIVGTFHQPPELLERDVLFGDLRGRVAKLAHRLNKNRFKHLSAAIVTNPNQAVVLEKVMPRERIHTIPLGLHINRLRPFYNLAMEQESKAQVITVGNWQRDWDFYFELVKKSPEIKFVLVNRKLDGNYQKMANGLSNLSFYENVDDEELYQLCAESDVQFLPIKGMAASNAIMDGLALGCPLVITDIGLTAFSGVNHIVKGYAQTDISEAITQINSFVNQSILSKQETRKACHLYAEQFDWKVIAERTVTLYHHVLEQANK